MSRSTFASIGIVAAALALGVSGAGAQGNVAPGEQRFNAGIYKASHNSYERGETTPSQIDNWNCWCLEMDLHWDGSQIWVEHFCGSTHDQETLASELDFLTYSLDAAERVTVVYLELKQGGFPCYEDWPSDRSHHDRIKDLVELHLGADRIYRASEFKSRDRHRWPSYQELLRRGYRWIVILDETDTPLAADSDFFLGATSHHPPTTGELPNSVLINISLGSAVPNPGLEPDRWLFRAYPGFTNTCGGDDDDEGYFYGAIDRGYNFIATNCVDQSYTMHHGTHSPSPLHVALGSGSVQYGTLAFPLRGPSGLVAAVGRASPMVPIRIDAGDYDVPAGTRFDRRVVLRGAGGLVRIR